jgi:hypothetical protein
MTLSHRFHIYWKETPTLAVLVDLLRLLAILASPFLALLLLRWMATNDLFVAPLHRRFWANSRYATAGFLYRGFLTFALGLNAAWMLRALRNFITITASRSLPAENSAHDDQKLDLPPWPYSRESFAVILGELQDRDGARVPNADSPNLKPRWLILPELSLYTGVFVTGGIGLGKTRQQLPRPADRHPPSWKQRHAQNLRPATPMPAGSPKRPRSSRCSSSTF